MENFIPTKHPTTGQHLKEAPQYGAALKEKRRQYHYPKSRAPAEDSFDEDSSADEFWMPKRWVQFVYIHEYMYGERKRGGRGRGRELPWHEIFWEML